MKTFLIIQLALTSFMTGLIWFVQLVHYPIFKLLSKESFADYEKKHIFPTIFVTLPIMLIETICAFILVFFTNTREIVSWTNMGGMFFLWISTIFIQVPLHTKISKNPTNDKIQKLIRTNWVRTLIWSARFIMLIYYQIEIR